MLGLNLSGRKLVGGVTKGLCVACAWLQSCEAATYSLRSCRKRSRRSWSCVINGYFWRDRIGWNSAGHFYECLIIESWTSTKDYSEIEIGLIVCCLSQLYVEENLNFCTVAQVVLSNVCNTFISAIQTTVFSLIKQKTAKGNQHANTKNRCVMFLILYV